MKKLCVWMLSVLALVSCLAGSAMAEAETDAFGLFSALLGGRELTLTVSAENIDGLEEFFAPCGSVMCTVKQENNQIVASVTCDGGAYLLAAADAQGIRLETNLLDAASIQCGWDTLMPNITLTGGEESRVLKITITGPDRELINFSCKVVGNTLDDYQLSFQGGLITGPGAVYGLWDNLSGKQGRTTRDFALTYDESEILVEAFGEETVESEETGCVIIHRRDDCTVYLDEDEIGSLTICSALRIQQPNTAR